jgi:site-specific DNA-methyltransferase (adenine-specific)
LIDLRCGDCLDVIRGGVKNGSIDLIVTDPPYLIKYKTNRRKNKQHDFCREIQNDNNPKVISSFFEEAYRVLKENSAMYVFTSWKTIDFFRECAIRNNFIIKNEIIWVKNNWTAGDLKAQFGQQYETIMLLNKGRSLFNGKRYNDVWNFKRVSGKEQVHQNQKPVDLIERCIESHSNKGDLVLDPFMGSGSTGVACKNLNRNFIGIELDEKYFEIAKERIGG